MNLPHLLGPIRFFFFWGTTTTKHTIFIFILYCCNIWPTYEPRASARYHKNSRYDAIEQAYTASLICWFARRHRKTKQTATHTEHTRVAGAPFVGEPNGDAVRVECSGTPSYIQTYINEYGNNKWTWTICRHSGRQARNVYERWQTDTLLRIHARDITIRLFRWKRIPTQRRTAS